MFETLRRDLVIAARSLSRVPGFTAAVVLTLALGIGGTATMFTAVNTAFLKPLPYPHEDRVTLVWQTSKQSRRVPVSMLDSLDWAARNRAFEHTATFGGSTVNVTSGASPARVPAGTSPATSSPPWEWSPGWAGRSLPTSSAATAPPW
ncbi:MAG TPA: hypothetical protein VHR45_01120 [Thermoanaerobaculia bacterium]|nr:hypothetical protein [Thermoanaerobaculia bacterium]